MLQPLCGLSVLDNVALLVVNAKQIADKHLKVAIVYTQISARQDLEHCYERAVLCRNKNVVTDQID